MNPKLLPADGNGEIVGIDDPFANLDNLRLTQDFAETYGVKKLLTTIPVRRPNPQDFIRVHPQADFRENLPAVDLKAEREMYVVTRSMQAELSMECVPATVFTAIIAREWYFSGRCACQGLTENSMNGGGRLRKQRRWR